jgi:hypothetical protein
MRRLDLGRIATGVTLALLVLVALWARTQYITVLGGTGNYVDWAKENYFGGITPVYLALGRALAGGQGYWVDLCGAADWLPWRWDFLCDSGYSPLLYPPGYPLFIAAWYSLGIEQLGTMRLVQAAVDSAGIVAAYVVARAAGAARPPALAGSVIVATFPLWAAGSTFLLGESLNVAFVLTTLAFLICATRSKRDVLLLGLGGWLGAGALFRPEFVLFVFAAAGWILLLSPLGYRARAVAILVVGFAIPIGSWGLYNKLGHGAWVFTSAGGGSGLYQGLGAIPNSHGYVVSDVRTQELLRARGLGWGTADADRFLKQEYLRAWREHPGHVLATIGERWKGIVFTSEVLRPDTMPGLRTAFDRYGLLLTLLAMLVYRRNRLALLVLATPLAYALLSIGLVHWEPRYVRYVPLSYLFAAVLLASAALAAVEHRSRVGGALVGAALLAAVFGYSAQALASLRWEAVSAEALVRLDEGRARGNLAAVPPPVWASTGIGTIELRDGVVRVVTGPEPFAYQATARLPAKAGVTAYLVEFEVEIDRGGATLGLLDPAGRWIEVRSRSEPGRLIGTVRGRARAGASLTLVLANHNPKGDSAFALRRLEILAEPAQDPSARR